MATTYDTIVLCSKCTEEVQKCDRCKLKMANRKESSLIVKWLKIPRSPSPHPEWEKRGRCHVRLKQTKLAPTSHRGITIRNEMCGEQYRSLEHLVGEGLLDEIDEEQKQIGYYDVDDQWISGRVRDHYGKSEEWYPSELLSDKMQQMMADAEYEDARIKRTEISNFYDRHERIVHVEHIQGQTYYTLLPQFKPVHLNPEGHYTNEHFDHFTRTTSIEFEEGYYERKLWYNVIDDGKKLEKRVLTHINIEPPDCDREGFADLLLEEIAKGEGEDPPALPRTILEQLQEDYELDSRYDNFDLCIFFSDQSTGEAPCVDLDYAEDQMDSAHEKAEGMIEGTMHSIGKFVDGLVGGDDCPAVLSLDGLMSLSDGPRLVKSVAFRGNDRTPSCARNFHQKKVDVCDLESRCHVQSLWAQTNWTTSSVVGAELLHPGRVTNGYANGGYNVVAPYGVFEQHGNAGLISHTAPSYYCQFFSYWRGSLEFTIEVLNTKFHQGQLFVAYQPWNDQVTTVPTFTAARNCMGAVIDLSACNRTTIKIPYNASTDYLYIPEGVKEVLKATMKFPVDSRRQCGMGQLMIFVMNPLTAPAAVSTSVHVNVWLKCGEDFELKWPRPLYDQVKVLWTWVQESQPAHFSEGDEMVEGEAELQQDKDQATAPSDAPSLEKPSGITMSQVPIDVNVRKADFKRVVSKMYPLHTGLTWTTSQTRAHVLYTESTMTLFAQEHLAYAGLFRYHNYCRMGFEITLKMNPNPMFCGLLAMFLVPPNCQWTTDQKASTYFAHLDQYIVAYYTPQSDTTVTVRVPWQRISRVAYVQNTGFPDSTQWPRLVIMVINQLHTGTGGSTQLSGMLMGRIVDPYIGFKRAIVTGGAYVDEGDETEQLDDETPQTSAGLDEGIGNMAEKETESWTDSTDTVLGEDCKTDIVKPIKPVRKRGFIQGRHAHLKNLLRRPAFVHSDEVTGTGHSTKWKQVMLVPGRLLSPTHSALVSTYVAWSGGLRWTFATAMGYASNTLMKFRMVPQETLQLPSYAIGSLTIEASQDYTGVAVKQVGSNETVTFASPYIAVTPAKWTTPSTNVASDFENRAERFSSSIIQVQMNVPPLYSGGSTNYAQTCAYWLYQSIADDFEVYIATLFPMMRPRQGTFETEEVIPHRQRENYPAKRVTVKGPQEEGWLRDLTQEGVEPNPGPYDELKASLEEALNQETGMIEEGFGDVARGVFNIPSSVMKWVTGKTGEMCIHMLSATAEKEVNRVYESVMKTILPTIAWASDYILNVYLLVAEGVPWTVKALSLTTLAAKLISTSEYGNKLLHQLTEVTSLERIRASEIFHSKRDVFNERKRKSGEQSPVQDSTRLWPEDQMEFNVVNLTGSVAVAVVAGLVSVMGVKFLKSDANKVRDLALWKLGEVGSTVGKMSTGVSGAKSLWKTVRSGLETGLSYFMEGEELYADWLKSKQKKITEWMEAVDECVKLNAWDNNNIFRPIAEGQFKGRVSFDVLSELSAFATEMRVHLMDMKGVPPVWSRTAEKVITCHAKAKKAYDSANIRLEPIGIWVEGAAGCGKSFMWSTIAPYLIMKGSGLVDSYAEAKRQVWAKPPDPEHVYFDNYASQHFVICDDFAAGTEDKDALQIINLISVATCPLNMADIEDKRTKFDSKFVCCTTNQKSSQVITTVRDKDALERRFPFCYHMSARGTSKVDLVKFQERMSKATTLAQLVTEVDLTWKFERLMLKSGVKGREESFKHILAEIVNTYKRRTKTDSSLDKVLDRLTGKFLSKGGARPAPELKFQLDSDLYSEVQNPTFQSWLAGIKPTDKMEEVAPLSSDSDVVSDEDAKDEGKSIFDLPRFKKGGGKHVIPEETPEMRVLYAEAREQYWKALEDPGKIAKFLMWVKGHPNSFGWETYDQILATGQWYLAEWKDGTINAAGFASMVWEADSRYSDDSNGEGSIGWRGLIGVIATGMCVAGAIGLAVYAYRTFKECALKVLDATECEEEGQHYDNSRKQPIKKPVISKTAPSVSAKLAEMQGLQLTEAAAKIRKNIRTISVSHVLTKAEFHLHCVAIDNRTLLVPAHFRDKVILWRNDGGCVVELQQIDRWGEKIGKVPITFDVVNSEEIVLDGWMSGTRDLCVVKMVDFVVANAKNIRQFIPDNKLRGQWYGHKHSCFFITPENFKKSVVSFEFRVRKMVEEMIHRKRGMRTSIEALVIGNTQVGDCGLPYVYGSASVHKPLIGLHVWGVDKDKEITGVADISVEAINEAERLISTRLMCPPTVEDQVVEEMKLKPKTCQWWNSNVEMLGGASVNGEELKRYDPDKSCFVRTGLNNPKWEDAYDISAKGVVKSGGETIHTLYTHVQKYEPVALLPVPTLVHHEAVSFMLRRVPSDAGRLYSMHEALNGTEVMSKVILSTSPGYLSKWFENGKKELVDIQEGEVLNGVRQPDVYLFSQKAHSFKIPIWNRSFVEHLAYLDDQLKQGQQPLFIWTATNKDELLSREKVKIGKTRVFVQPGFDYTILMRRYFGSFLDWYKSHAGFKLSHGIGIDKDAAWGDIWTKLKEVGDYGFDLDYTNYDGSVIPHASNAFLHIVDQFYGGKLTIEQAALIQAMTNAVVVAGEYTIRTQQGNKSGNPCTDVFNSVTNWYIQLVGMKVAAEIHDRPVDLEATFPQVRCLTYGDDVITAVPDEMLTWYNRKQVGEVLDMLGYKCTSASKDSEMKPYDKLEDLTFLKSPFREEDGIVKAPLPLKVIHRELQWGKKMNVGNLTIMRQKEDDALEMIKHHGRDKWKELYVQITGRDPLESDYTVWLAQMRAKQCATHVENINASEYVQDKYRMESQVVEQEGDQWADFDPDSIVDEMEPVVPPTEEPNNRGGCESLAWLGAVFAVCYWMQWSWSTGALMYVFPWVAMLVLWLTRRVVSPVARVLRRVDATAPMVLLVLMAVAISFGAVHFAVPPGIRAKQMRERIQQGKGAKLEWFKPGREKKKAGGQARLNWEIQSEMFADEYLRKHYERMEAFAPFRELYEEEE